MRKHGLLLGGLLLAGIGTLLPDMALAHFKFLEPPSALVTEDGGKGAPPCGAGIPSGIVTKAQGGHPFTVRLLEFIPHPGHYRIALSVNSRAELPKDADAEVKDGKSVSAPIDAQSENPRVDGWRICPHHYAAQHRMEGRRDAAEPQLR